MGRSGPTYPVAVIRRTCGGGALVSGGLRRPVARPRAGKGARVIEDGTEVAPAGGAGTAAVGTGRASIGSRAGATAPLGSPKQVVAGTRVIAVSGRSLVVTGPTPRTIALLTTVSVRLGPLGETRRGSRGTAVASRIARSISRFSAAALIAPACKEQAKRGANSYGVSPGGSGGPSTQGARPKVSDASPVPTVTPTATLTGTPRASF